MSLWRVYLHIPGYNLIVSRQATNASTKRRPEVTLYPISRYTKCSVPSSGYQSGHFKTNKRQCHASFLVMPLLTRDDWWIASSKQKVAVPVVIPC